MTYKKGDNLKKFKFGGLIVACLSAVIFLAAGCSADSSSGGSDEVATIASVEVTSNATDNAIAADGNVTFTAGPSFTGGDKSSEVTYKWEITQADEAEASSSDYFTLSESTSSTVSLTANNSDTSSSHTVTVKVTATYNGKSVESSITVTAQAKQAEENPDPDPEPEPTPEDEKVTSSINIAFVDGSKDLSLTEETTADGYKFTATAPVSGTYTYTWRVGGDKQEETSNTLTIKELTLGTHSIFVETVNANVKYSANFTIIVK